MAAAPGYAGAIVFPAGTDSALVISTPLNVALFRLAHRFDDSDSACAANEVVTSTRIPIFEYLIGSAFQKVCTRIVAKLRGTLDYTESRA
jgi:hypothetical protein